METIYGTKRLSNGQAMLLRLFERDLPGENLLEIKNILSRYLFEKAQQEADKAMKAKGMTLKQLNQEIDELNNGSRTEYLKRIRKAKNESSH